EGSVLQKLFAFSNLRELDISIDDKDSSSNKRRQLRHTTDHRWVSSSLRGLRLRKLTSDEPIVMESTDGAEVLSYRGVDYNQMQGRDSVKVGKARVVSMDSMEVAVPFEAPNMRILTVKKYLGDLSLLPKTLCAFFAEERKAMGTIDSVPSTLKLLHVAKGS